MIKINGVKKDIDKINLLDYLLECGFKPEVIAVELNGTIVKKADYATTTLSDGDSVEIVSFVGGG